MKRPEARQTLQHQCDVLCCSWERPAEPDSPPARQPEPPAAQADAAAQLDVAKAPKAGQKADKAKPAARKPKPAQASKQAARPATGRKASQLGMDELQSTLKGAEDKYKAEKQPQLETLASFLITGCKGHEVVGSNLLPTNGQHSEVGMA